MGKFLKVVLFSLILLPLLISLSVIIGQTYQIRNDNITKIEKIFALSLLKVNEIINSKIISEKEAAENSLKNYLKSQALIATFFIRKNDKTILRYISDNDNTLILPKTSLISDINSIPPSYLFHYSIEKTDDSENNINYIMVGKALDRDQLFESVALITAILTFTCLIIIVIIAFKNRKKSILSDPQTNQTEILPGAESEQIIAAEIDSSGSGIPDTSTEYKPETKELYQNLSRELDRALNDNGELSIMLVRYSDNYPVDKYLEIQQLFYSYVPTLYSIQFVNSMVIVAVVRDLAVFPLVAVGKDLIRELKKNINKGNNWLASGIASRNKRDITPLELVKEGVSALKQSIKDNEHPVVGFQIDKHKYSETMNKN